MDLVNHDRSKKGPMTIKKFAWRVAGPRDSFINFVINATISFWVFKGMDMVPLTGSHSVASVVLPMSFLLCTLTTFFGWFNAVKERRTGAVGPAFKEGTKWAGQAWLNGLAVGLPAFLIALGITFGVDQLAPDTSVGFWKAVLGIGSGAAVLGYVLHSMAIERGGDVGRAAI